MPFPPVEDLPHPGIELEPLMSPALAPPGKPQDTKAQRLRNLPEQDVVRQGSDTGREPTWCCWPPALGAYSPSGQTGMVSDELLGIKRVFECVLVKRNHFFTDSQDHLEMSLFPFLTGIFGDIWKHFQLSRLRLGLLLALHGCYWTFCRAKTSPTTKNFLVQNVHSAMVEKLRFIG